MSDAPEKIWAARGLYDTVPNVRNPGPTEYTRSDIAERQIAELRAGRDKAREAAAWQENCWKQERDLKLEYLDLLKAAEACEARLSEAMEPLVELIGAYDCADEDGGYDDQSLITVPLGKLRALRAALSGSGAGGWRQEQLDAMLAAIAKIEQRTGKIYVLDPNKLADFLAAPTGEAK